MTETNTASPQLVERFPSLAAMSAAHRVLLKRHRDKGDSAEITTGIESFIHKGRATGALLDDEDNRWVAQGLLDYWTTKVYRTGYEPPDGTLDDFDPSLAPELPDELCPFLGLDAFREDDRDVFFGRQNAVDAMIKLLKDNRLLAIVGPSGSGKSSLVMAGLLPKLHAGALPNSKKWRYFRRLTPGQDPLRDLATLIQPAETGNEWIDQQVQAMLHSTSHFTLLLEQPDTPPAVIVVDQFEEVFTLCNDENARMAFINSLLGLVESPNARHLVIVTLRIDFVSQVARISKLQALFDKASVNVAALNASELRDTIVKPAELIGLKFEEGLVEELVREVLGEPAALPLLQFSLLKLWESRERNRVTWAAYQKMGGGRKALAHAADTLYNSLIPEDQVACKRILLKIVRPSEGLEVTSNRVPRSILYTGGEARDRVDRVLEHLLKAHLLKQSEGSTPGDIQIEMAHEALVRNWPLLVDWLDEERTNLRNRLRLTAAARQWKQMGREKGALLRGVMLHVAESYTDLSELEQEFVRASQAAAEAARKEKEDSARRLLESAQALAEANRLQAEQATALAEEQTRRADIERKRAEDAAHAAKQLRRRAYFLTAALVVAGVLAFLAVGFGRQSLINAQEAATNAGAAQIQAATANSASTEAVANAQIANEASVLAQEQQRTAQAASILAVAQQNTAVAERNIAATAKAEAEQNATIAFTRQLAVQSLNYLELQPDLALLLGVEASRAYDTVEARNALLYGLQRGLLQLAVPVGNPLASDEGYVNSVAFSADGNVLAAGTQDGPIVLWDADQQTALRKLIGHKAKVFSLSFSSDGKTLASSSADGTVILWDYASNQILFQTPQSPLSLLSVAFSPDGAQMAVSRNDSRIEIWNVAARQQIGLLEGGHFSDVWSIAWSPDGKLLASASNDSTARIWDVENRRSLLTLRGGHAGAVRSVVWTPNGKQVVTGGVDGLIVVWDAATGKPVGDPLRAHTDRVLSLAFHPNGKTLASGSADRSVILWDFANRRPIDTLRDHTHWIISVAFDPTGKLLASGSIDETVALRQIVEEQRLGEPLTGARGPLESAALVAETALAVTRGGTGAALWDISANTQIVSFNNADRVALSQDGALAAVASKQGLALYSLRENKFLEVKFEGDYSPPLALAFNQDNTVLAASTCGETDANGFCVNNILELWDTATGQLTLAQDTWHADSVVSLAFSPDGKFLATGSRDKTIILHDAVTRVPIGLPLNGHTGSVTSLAFSPDGRTLASGGADKTLILWGVETRLPIGRPFSGHFGAITTLAFSSDSNMLLSGSDRGELTQWVVSSQEWARRACEIAKRNLSQAEWTQFLAANFGDYHKTCEQWPEGK